MLHKPQDIYNIDIHPDFWFHNIIHCTSLFKIQDSRQEDCQIFPILALLFIVFFFLLGEFLSILTEMFVIRVNSHVFEETNIIWQNQVLTRDSQII